MEILNAGTGHAPFRRISCKNMQGILLIPPSPSLVKNHLFISRNIELSIHLLLFTSGLISHDHNHVCFI